MKNHNFKANVAEKGEPQLLKNAAENPEPQLEIKRGRVTTLNDINEADTESY